MTNSTGTRMAADPNPNAVVVSITPGNPDRGEGPKVDKETVRLSLMDDQEVVWTCTEPSQMFKIIFKGESPFQERVFHSNGKNRSGRPRAEIRPDDTRSYTYSVICCGITDPDVIVEK